MKLTASLFSYLIISSALFLISCSSEPDNPLNEEVTIGSQTWMTQNLNVDRFRNGDMIPEASDRDAWREAGENREPAWTYYNETPSFGDRHGKLYNWYAVNDPRGLAPEGWRIPDDEDWAFLTENAGGEYSAFSELTKMNGFALLKGGYRGLNEIFNGMDNTVYLWSSSETGENHASFFYLSGIDDSFTDGSLLKSSGMYVRVLRK